jgi:hypothetical protein
MAQGPSPRQFCTRTQGDGPFAPDGGGEGPGILLRLVSTKKATAGPFVSNAGQAGKQLGEPLQGGGKYSIRDFLQTSWDFYPSGGDRAAGHLRRICGARHQHFGAGVDDQPFSLGVDAADPSRSRRPISSM